MNASSEARLQLVHSKLAERVRSMADLLEAEHIEIHVTQGLRSWDEQQELWNKGRDAEGNITDPAEVVTHAKPGHSYHNFGLAVDVAPFVGGIPDWNSADPAWQRIVAVGTSCGLVAGAKWRSFPDAPHFQMTGFLPVSPDDSVRDAYLKGGIDAVWAQSGLDA